MLDRVFFFFFNDTATTEIYTLSLHDALPIWPHADARRNRPRPGAAKEKAAHHQEGDPHLQQHAADRPGRDRLRSEEHTSELQSQSNLVCRLLLEKKKITRNFSSRNRLLCETV